MKKNKLWSIVLMLVIMLGTVITFSSCGDDDDDNGGGSTASALVGKWQRDNTKKDYYTFSSNGKCHYESYSSTGELKMTMDMTWSASSDRISFTYQGQTMAMKYSVEGEVLYLYDDGDDAAPSKYIKVN